MYTLHWVLNYDKIGCCFGGVNAIIDAEVEQIRSVRSLLQDQHDKAQNIINLASLITGGALGVVNTALQFSSSTANWGNGIGVGGGAASVVLSIVGMRKQSAKATLGDSPRMLGRFFGHQPVAAEATPSQYPETVWFYLNSVSPDQTGKATRRELLIDKWKREGKIDGRSSSSADSKLDIMSGNASRARKFSIAQLDDRIAMLLDVRARVSLMKLGLAEIMRSLSSR